MTIGYHRLPARLFGAMAAGGGGPAAAEILNRAQHSKHALLLLGVVTTAEAAGHREHLLARHGYDLLAVAQDHDAGAANSVIRYPSVGAWARRTVAALRGAAGMPGATPGGLAGVAAAAAIRAGVPAEIEVPVNDGLVMLPSVGAAGPVDAEVATVRSSGRRAAVRGSGARAEVSAAGRRIVIPDRHRDRADRWHPLRPLQAGSLGLLVDDVDPFRMPAAPNLAAAADSGSWSGVFGAAWALLERDHPAIAREVAEIVTVIVPLARPPHGLVSSSSPETFGAIALSEPADACTLASTLAHEVQHVKLSALLDLIQLTRPDDGRRFYAPWRDDPRPVSGLLQGAYAYLGVTGFWRRQRELSDQLEPQVEFARWRAAAALVADVLESSGRLTATGQEFVRGMSATLRAWQADPVPDLALQRASEENGRHWARWETAHGPIPA